MASNASCAAWSSAASGAVHVLRARGELQTLEPRAPRPAADDARRLDDDDRLARPLQRPRRAEARETRANYHDVGVEVVGHLIRCWFLVRALWLDRCGCNESSVLFVLGG